MLYLQTKWDHYESESDYDEEMEVDEGDDSDDMETTLPSIDDVLDTETWRRKQQLHKQQSNVRLNFLVVSGMMLLKIWKHLYTSYKCAVPSYHSGSRTKDETFATFWFSTEHDRK